MIRDMKLSKKEEEMIMRERAKEQENLPKKDTSSALTHIWYVTNDELGWDVIESLIPTLQVWGMDYKTRTLFKSKIIKIIAF